MQGVDWFTVIFTVIISFVSAVIGAVIGGFITAYVSWWYYVWSSEDLKEEIKSLKQRFEELSRDVRQEILGARKQLWNIEKHIVYLIQLLADAGQIKPPRDDKGTVRIPHESTRSDSYPVKDYETEEREREERETRAREARDRELSRRPLPGLLRSIRRRIFGA
jgi:hypothetical protein